MKRHCFYLPEDLMARVRAYAKAHHLSLADVMRLALDHYLKSP